MKLARFLALSSLLTVASLSVAQSLDIGDKAPQLNVAKWVKGSPQTIGNGNVTVVEFWATWCGPCKQAIPHLTDLAHKFKGKVNFIGVSVWEREPKDYKIKVPAFVKEFGPKMDYNVATEGPNAFMANHWMKAAGEGGIPTAFLIDKAGKIAWIGHPMDEEFSKVIDRVLSGMADLSALREKRFKAKTEAKAEAMAQEKAMEKFNPIVEEIRAKKYQEASEQCDKLEKSNPELKSRLCQYKLMAMSQGKLPGIAEYLTSLGNEDFAKDPMLLNQIIWTVAEGDLGLSAEIYAATVTLGEKMIALDPKNPFSLDTFALALWRSGDKVKALENQKAAVAIVVGNKNISADTVKDMKEHLKRYGG